MNDRIRVMQRQPRRISITLSHNVHEDLLNRSELEGRSVSNLCAYLLEESLKSDRHQKFSVPPNSLETGLSQNGSRHQLRSHLY